MLCWQGVSAAEDLLAYLRVPIDKALNPLDPRDFLTINARLARALSGKARAAWAPALREAVNGLDVDWGNMSAQARTRIVQASRDVLAQAVGPAVLPAVHEVFEVNAPKVAVGAKKATQRRYKLDIDVSLDAVDEATLKNATKNQLLFVRDALGNRVEDFSKKARNIVANGLESGLGRDDIAVDLAGALGDLGRSDAYWRMTAANFTNRARTYGQLRSLDDGGVDTYVFRAMMDSKTSLICQFLNGKSFDVKRALNRYAFGHVRGKQDNVDVMPWVSQGKNDDGDSVLYFDRGGKRYTVAHVDEPADDASDDEPVTFRKGFDESQLEAAGITAPPVHGHCRSTIVLGGE